MVCAQWTVTLVLMKIDEHSIASRAEPIDHHFIAPHYAALLQTAIIFLGSVARFFLNDLRNTPGIKGGRPYSIGLGVVAYLGATTIWVLTTVNLLMHVGYPHEKTTYEAQEDAYVLWILAIVQAGYPFISLVQILCLNCLSKTLKPGAKGPMPADQMDPLLSTFKDVGYGVLDSVCKGGLALFCALRASRSIPVPPSAPPGS